MSYYDYAKTNLGIDYNHHGEWDHQFVRMLVNTLKIPKGANVVDVGCACGKIMQAFKEEGYRCVGIESDDVMVEIARQNGHLVLQHDLNFPWGEILQ